MKLEKILKDYPDCECKFSIEKVEIQTVDGDVLSSASMDTGDPDLPIVITQDGVSIKIPNRDIPQFVTAIAMMCDENYF